MLYKISIAILILLPVVFGLEGKQLVEYAVKQYNKLTKTVKSGQQYPSEGDPMSPTWHTTGGVTGQWTAGFYPGILWHLYNYTKSEEWKTLAIQATDGIFNDQLKTDTHDIGFMIMCSYGNGYEFTKNASYPKIIANAAHHLALRFNPIIGCTRSWNSGNNGQFLVIADNMMNLELLFEGWKHTGNKTLYDMAVSHTNKTIKEHIRSDFTHFHVVSFNETNGKVIRKFTAQGYADSSCWAQSQAWLIAGLTIAYRYTKYDYILKAAEGVSNYFIDNSPEDGITYWDFNVPHDQNHKYIPRDSSAATIAASGLLELHRFTNNDKYLKFANTIMESLFSDKYRANGNSNYKIPALIVNGTADYNKKNFDTALIFGDYYFAKSISYYL